MVDEPQSFALAMSSSFSKECKETELSHILTKSPQEIGVPSQIDRGKAAEEAKGKPNVKQKRAFKMSNLMLISTFALLLAAVSAINTKNSQPVLWRQSDTQITTGHYDVHLLIKLVSPCELLSNETVHHDVLLMSLKRCEDIYQTLFMAEIENMFFARNYTEVTIQKRGIWLAAGLVGGSVVVTAGIATSALVIAVSNKFDISSLRSEMAEAEKKIDRLDTKIQHIEKAIMEFKNDLDGVVKQLETHEMDLDLFKERSASTNFAIFYITGRMLIGNQILKNTTVGSKSTLSGNDGFLQHQPAVWKGLSHRIREAEELSTITRQNKAHAELCYSARQ